MNIFNLCKYAEMRGEFWIHDGTAMFADGDIGDYNHEAYVIEVVQSQIINGEEDWEEWKNKTVLEILEEKKQELEEKKLDTEEPGDIKDIDDQIYEIWEMSKNTSYYAYELIGDNLEELGIEPEYFEIAKGQGDAREFAMKHWGWKRLEEDNIETWFLKENDLRDIANGLYDAYDDVVINSNFNIYVYSSNKYYTDVPFQAIETGDIIEMHSYANTRRNIFDLYKYAKKRKKKKKKKKRNPASTDTELRLDSVLQQDMQIPLINIHLASKEEKPYFECPECGLELCYEHSMCDAVGPGWHWCQICDEYVLPMELRKLTPEERVNEIVRRRPYKTWL